MEFVDYQVVNRIAVITLDRPEKANAQTTAMLREIDSCWTAAGADRGVRVIVVAANGRHFSAGMDLTNSAERAEYYSADSLHFFGRTLAWRNVPKPSIAAVQGKCVAAGLMLCWPCDLIIAAEDAEFSDPTMRMGLAGIQYMAHAWELGPRKAKELLFRSSPLRAEEARQLGMVNRVVPGERLRDEAMTWARDIAELDPRSTALVKRGINGLQDTQGFTASLEHGFDLQELFQTSAPRNGSDVLQKMRAFSARAATPTSGP